MEKINYGDPALRQDPYPVYTNLRRGEAITYARSAYMGDVVLVTRYDDVLAGLKHPKISSDFKNSGAGSDIFDAWWMPKVFKILQESMITLDDPAHRRLRDLVHPAFTPRVIARMESRIHAVVDDLLDKLEEKETADLLADFALPVPLTVISDMLGVPEKDRPRFHKWSYRYLEVATGDPKIIISQLPNGLRLFRFFKKLLRLRRRAPQDDLLTRLIEAEIDGDRLGEDELIAMIFLLLLAGHETTVNLIGTGTLALLEHPDQLALLRAEPDLIETAVEELLRYGNPVEHGSPRFATEDLELGGVEIKKGSMIYLLISSANRDETVFPDPDRLDIRRSPNRHLAFGFGVHYCLGAPLARLEGKIAIRKLVARFPDMRLAVPREQLEWRNTTAVRGLKKLPMVMR